MPNPSITGLLDNWSHGNPAALDELAPRVQQQLHTLARSYLRRYTGGQTLQPTALINEVYLRLIGQAEPIQWEGRAHFFGIAARLMRNVLVDYSRARRASKRGGGALAITLAETAALSPTHTPDVLDVDEALSRLARVDQRKAKVIEWRYFGGMTAEEIACVSQLSIATVKRDLRFGVAWLRHDLTG
uniref:RNA polymerase, sigma-24 subunit, ECF subfamily n=1 Tax=Solibacter usitatus (strain Ellin6076) TaxID=234267 RepID=Q021H1_SOLUE